VRANIGFPLKCQGVSRKEIRAGVEQAARILHIDHLLDRRVSGLASGDRQRVALGRSIVRRPKAFLMDEPLGALDAEFRHIMTGELRALHDRVRATTVYVTHDQLEAMSLADKIAIMNHGVVEQLGTPREIYERPASLFVADFIGTPPMNFLRFRSGLCVGALTVRLGDAVIAVPEIREEFEERDLLLGVRPEDVRLRDGGAVAGEVFGAEYLGTTQIVTLTTPYGTVRARLPADVTLQRGEHVGLDFRPEKLSLFDKTTGRAVRTALTERGAVYG